MRLPGPCSLHSTLSYFFKLGNTQIIPPPGVEPLGFRQQGSYAPIGKVFTKKEDSSMARLQGIGITTAALLIALMFSVHGSTQQDFSAVEIIPHHVAGSVYYLEGTLAALGRPDRFLRAVYTELGGEL
jgi:hypothetical protein